MLRRPPLVGDGRETNARVIGEDRRVSIARGFFEDHLKDMAYMFISHPRAPNTTSERRLATFLVLRLRQACGPSNGFGLILKGGAALVTHMNRSSSKTVMATNVLTLRFQPW